MLQADGQSVTTTITAFRQGEAGINYKDIRFGIKNYKISLLKVYHWIYAQESHLHPCLAVVTN